MKIKFQGILMLKDPSFGKMATKYTLPEKAVLIPSQYTHITLIHQSILKPYEDILESGEFVFPPIPKIQFENKIWHRIDLERGRETWALKVTSSTQKALEKFVGKILKDLGITTRENRTFHISLANLTGNPRESVR